MKTYISIDLKSFYASVECVERGLDPLNTNLVVADKSRTEKTICLAVSPSLKSFGISGRARLFEVIQRVEQINKIRKHKINKFVRKSYIYSEIMQNPLLELDYITAVPHMSYYMKVSAKIYEIYLKYVAPEDIFAYSVDEVFIDATSYLKTYHTTAYGFAEMLIKDVLKTTGITATAGIGTNMYLCKVAMDIVAKHIPADKDGVRIAELNEQTYKEKLWSHTPITDFWRVGNGIANRLKKLGIYTMGDIAKNSLDHDKIKKIYKSLGKNAELLIDHAWGVEPTTIADVKAYKPQNNSISSGQVLQAPTNYEHTKTIVWEMADSLSLDLVEKRLVTNQIVLTIGYDHENMKSGTYKGEFVTDRYGRNIPKHAHGTENLEKYTSSTHVITEAVVKLFERIINRNLFSRRINLTACNVIKENEIPENYEQLSLFDTEAKLNKLDADEKSLEKEHNLQEAILEIKHKYGKNSLLKGRNFSEGATAIERNKQIGGHKA